MRVGVKKRASLDFYSFFEEVTMRHFGVEEWTRQEVARVEQGYAYLTDAFHDKGEVDYSDPDVQKAYLLSYAPRYAHLWTLPSTLPDELRWRNARFVNPQRGVLKYNVMGPGPGSEIVGLVSSLKLPAGTRVDLSVCEKEKLWLPVLHTALEILEENQPVKMPIVLHPRTPRQFEPSYPVIGSYVLSDLCRQGKFETTLQAIAETCRGMPGWFIDTYDYTDENNEAAHIEDLFSKPPLSFCVNLHVSCPGIGMALKKMFNRVDRPSCQHPLTKDTIKAAWFKLNFPR